MLSVAIGNYPHTRLLKERLAASPPAYVGWARSVISSYSLGIATTGGYCDQIIERNAPIPIEQSRLFSTSTDNQTEVVVWVEVAHLGQQGAELRVLLL